MKKAIWAVLIVLFAVSCSGKKETGTASASSGEKATASSGENATAKSSGGSTGTVKAGTPAPASDFDVSLSTKDGVDVVLITDYKGKAKNLTIPATIEDYPVFSVSIKSLNPNVEQLFIPEGVESVGLQDNINNPVAFPNLRAVSLPNTLKSIGSFNGCINLNSIIIPSSVTYIVNNAFKGTGLQSVAIPSSVETIGPNAFSESKSLTSVEIFGNFRSFLPFWKCDNLKTVIINEGVTEIGESTFNGLKLLETLKLPESLTSIGTEAFKDSTSLTSIVIPKGVNAIYSKAFENSGLTEITILKNDEVLELYNDAFKDCKNLVTVNFEDGATINFIGTGHFSGCPNLSLKSQAAIKKAKGGGL